MTSGRSFAARLPAFLPAIVWACAIFIASSIPSSHLPSSAIFRQDKLIHMGIYAVLAVLVYRGFRKHAPARTATQAALATLGVCILYGVTDELHQHFVPGRSMDVFDLLADALGSALAVVLAVRYERRRKVPPAAPSDT